MYDTKPQRRFTGREFSASLAVILLFGTALVPVLSPSQQSDRDVTIQRMKALWTAATVYSADYDDTYPAAFASESASVPSRPRWQFWTVVPEGWRRGLRDREPEISDDGHMWANALRFYIQNPGLDTYALAAIDERRLQNVDYTNVNRQPQRVGLVFNGMLHYWPTTAITRPDNLPLFSAMHYRQNVLGFTVSNPALDCGTENPCRFNPDRPPARNGGRVWGFAWWNTGGDQRVFIYGNRWPYVTVGGNATAIPLLIPDWPRVSKSAQFYPWSSLNPNEPGEPFWMSKSVAPGSDKSDPPLTRYPAFFRPDSSFNWKDSEIDYGG